MAASRGVRSVQWRGRSPTHRWWCSRWLHCKTVLGLILTESCRFPYVFQWKHNLIYKVERKRMHWILSLKYFIIQSVYTLLSDIHKCSSHVCAKQCTETPHQTSVFISVSYWLVRFTHSLPELETFETCLDHHQQQRGEPVKARPCSQQTLKKLFDSKFTDSKSCTEKLFGAQLPLCTAEWVFLGDIKAIKIPRLGFKRFARCFEGGKIGLYCKNIFLQTKIIDIHC